MATLQLNSSDNLVKIIYHHLSASLKDTVKVEETDKSTTLTLENGDVFDAPNTLISQLVSLSGKPELLGAQPAQQADVQQWLTTSITTEDPAELAKTINTSLSGKSYLPGPKSTLSDLALYARVRDHVSSIGLDTQKSLLNLMRWFNKIQMELNNALSQATIQEITLDLEALNLNPKKKEKKAKEPAAAAAPLVISPGLVDLRVGKITSVKVHPDAESLYVESIDFGEEEQRTIVSGLVKHYTLEQMQDRLLVGVCNLKPAALRGIKSFGMVLCSTSAEGKVEFVDPSAGAKPGDRVYFEGFEDVVPEAQLNPKKKIWEQIQPGLNTNGDRVANFTDSETGKVHLMRSSAGTCSCPNNINAPIK